MPERLEAPAMASLGALRVVEAVWARTELGQRFQVENDQTLEAV